MIANTINPVLLVGGSGVIGSLVAKTLRRLHPDLPIAVGGRTLAAAEKVAREVGHATAVQLDVSRSDLGLPGQAHYSAVAIFFKDNSFNALKYALAHSLPYVSISYDTFEMAPEVALYIHSPARSAVMLASHWLVGAMTLPAIRYAKEFRVVESIDLALFLDEGDLGGPASYADFETEDRAVPPSLRLNQGRWSWANGNGLSRKWVGVNGVEATGTTFATHDLLSLWGATAAESIRAELVLRPGPAASVGKRFTTELIVEISGERHDGSVGRVRHEVVYPNGQAEVTALGDALAIERLLGLGAHPRPEPGLYLPEIIIDPAYMLAHLEQIGTTFKRIEI